METMGKDKERLNKSGLVNSLGHYLKINIITN